MKNRGGSADNLLNLLFPINFFFLFYENIKVKEETMYFFFLLYRVTFLHFHSLHFPLIVFFLRLLRETNCKLDFAIYNYMA